VQRQNQRLTGYVADTLAAMAQQNAENADRDAVKSDIVAKLNALGLESEQFNERIATPLAAMFDTYAKATGVTASELYAESTPAFLFGELAPKTIR
jgi:hypothetical protein